MPYSEQLGITIVTADDPGPRRARRRARWLVVAGTLAWPVGLVLVWGLARLTAPNLIAARLSFMALVGFVLGYIVGRFSHRRW